MSCIGISLFNLCQAGVLCQRIFDLDAARMERSAATDAQNTRLNARSPSVGSTASTGVLTTETVRDHVVLGGHGDERLARRKYQPNG